MSKVAAGRVRSMYAAPKDFCVIFDEDMNILYSLALLLTGDHAIAEQCFLAALDDCHKGSDVLPEWTRSWSRRSIVKAAIRLVGPLCQSRATEAAFGALADDMDSPSRLMQLPAFERFVFAMSVLERYSTRECAVLLNCEAREVEQTRGRVLQLMARERQSLAPALFDNVSRRQPMSAVNAG